MGHRRQVTAVTRLPRWRRRKTRLQVKPLLTMLQDMGRSDFLHAKRYGIELTCDTLIVDHHASEWPRGALVFSGGRRVTSLKEAGDWGFRGGWLIWHPGERVSVALAIPTMRPRQCVKGITLWGKAKDTTAKISIMQDQFPCINPNKFIGTIIWMIMKCLLFGEWQKKNPTIL